MLRDQSEITEWNGDDCNAPHTTSAHLQWQQQQQMGVKVHSVKLFIYKRFVWNEIISFFPEFSFFIINCKLEYIEQKIQRHIAYNNKMKNKVNFISW